MGTSVSSNHIVRPSTIDGKNTTTLVNSTHTAMSATNPKDSLKSSTISNKYSFEDSYKNFTHDDNSFFGDNKNFYSDKSFKTTQSDEFDFKTTNYDDMFSTGIKKDEYDQHDDYEFDETDIRNIKSFLATYGKEMKERDSRKNSEAKNVQKS